MFNQDPRFATYPAQPGVLQLRWLIQNVAEGKLPVHELIRHFRLIHESIEKAGRPRYASKEESRLIWDILWVLEFYSPDPAKEAVPDDWNDAATVLTEVRRVARAFKKLDKLEAKK
jgi:hypothetical protein